MKQWFRNLTTALFFALVGAGSGTVSASETGLDHILSNAGAIVTTVPKLDLDDHRATLSYLGDLNCNTLRSLENCQSYTLVCDFGTPGTLRLVFKGLGVSYVPFTRMIKGSYRFPFITYTDPIVQRYSRKYGKALDYEKDLVSSEVKFEFDRAERLGEFDAGSYAITWETATYDEASELLEMLSSGNLLLLAVPESTNSQTFYHRLPPSPEGKKINLAAAFATTCISRWERRP
jgi:hypothetical protein